MSGTAGGFQQQFSEPAADPVVVLSAWVADRPRPSSPLNRLANLDLVVTNFTVFPARASDGDALGEIHAASWTAAYAGFFAPEFFAEAIRQRRTKWHDMLSREQDSVILAALDGRPLAFSYRGVSPARPGSAEIFGFYGHPDAWGTGIASALMTATLDSLRESGIGHVHLWTLRDTPRSRRFYAKCGFTESGETRGHDFGDGRPVEQVEYHLTFSRA
ncbi:GNAT family N-acetyltransferase [Microbispora sp. RL4-1S]|uniref:GNAT family N-acetyltransferase n=1 Tax=Microbispora oryzae TaxID=2806554 RepID=A0A941AQM8_9ACTN|nr:GNAT family N-acetyltransferase [Microbispora oryzae]MBP2704939.1 GNAT family N-acetyltransferase [Microbispora oryzae]